MAKVNIVRPGEGEILGSGAQRIRTLESGEDRYDSGQPVNAETMKPLWKTYATEISDEYDS